MSTVSRTVARLLAESLEAHDVDQIYCVPGESYVGLTSELLQRNSMRVVVCRHETGATDSFVVGRRQIRGFWPISAHLASPVRSKALSNFLHECRNNIDTMNIV